MLKRRIIPKLLLTRKFMGNRDRDIIVATRNFRNPIVVGDPVSQAKVYESQMADELLFLDIEAANANRTISFELVRQLAEELFMPFTVGGGVRKLDDFYQLLKNGADKVCINTAALENSALIGEAAEVFGAQCVVVSIDYRRADTNASATVFSRAGQAEKRQNPLDWALECQERGAGEIVLTSIDKDGSKLGLDLPMLAEITAALSIPVVASGGCGSTQHFIEGFLQGGADAVSAGTFFAFKDENPIQTRAHIKNAGIPIR